MTGVSRLLAGVCFAAFASFAQAQDVHTQCSTGASGFTQWIPCPATNGAAGAIGQPVYSTVVTANSSHTSGQCVGPTTAITTTVNAGQSGYLLNAALTATTAITPTLILYVFHTNPSGSTCADGGTFALATADITKLVAPPRTVTLAAPAAVGTPTFGEINYTPPYGFIAGGSASSGVPTLYYQIVTSTTVTPGASGIILEFSVALN